MFTLYRQLMTAPRSRVEIPTLAIAFIIAEFCYKFHSFTLECLGFLLTWFVLTAAAHACARVLFPDKRTALA